jgi:hypothetical protein
VLATERALAEEFATILGGSAGHTLPGADPNKRIKLETDRPNTGPSAAPISADGLLLLIRHLDEASFREARSILAGLPADIETALVVATIRESGQSEFKMSCTCGQKLYVSDAQIGKQGRCPACGRRFTLPAEDDLVRAHLTMEPPVTVVHLVRGHRSLYQTAVAALMSKIEDHGEAVKRQTMRIQIPDDTSS